MVGQLLAVGDVREGCGAPVAVVVRERSAAVGSACWMYCRSSRNCWKSVSMCSCPGMSCISTLTRYWPFSPSKCACGSDNEDMMEDPEGLAVVVLEYCCGVTCGRVGDLSSPEWAASPSDSSTMSCLDTSKFLGGVFLAVVLLAVCCRVTLSKVMVGVSVSSSSANNVNLLWLGAL